MADKDETGKKAGISRVAAFASHVHSQQKYIVFNLEAFDYDITHNPLGAGRILPGVASHELFHTLGFDHPKKPAQPGEVTDTRGWEQIRQDITSQLNAANALGTLQTTGKRIITYSFAADPTQVPINSATVEGMRHLGDTADTQRNKLNQRIKSAMTEAFAEHSDLFGVTFQESKDPRTANLLVYSGVVPSQAEAAIDLSGGKNPYTKGVTVMSYNPADPSIFPMSGVGDIYAAQMVYGLPPTDPKRRIVTAERLAHHSGVLWDNKPMAIKLTQSPMLGALTIDMGAHPFVPAITGTLKDKEGDKKVRQHIGAHASINEVDATDSEITLDVTGTTGATIKTGKKTNVSVKGRNSNIVFGSAADTIVDAKGFGHTLANLEPDDIIGAKAATKARLQHWTDAEGEKGTLITFIGDDAKHKGSIFVKDTAPDKVIPRLKDIVTTEQNETKAPLTLNAVDGTKGMATAPPVAYFRDQRNVCITAKSAAGHGVSNLGGGCIIVKMTQPQYDSRTVKFVPDSQHYALSFRDADGEHKVNLQQTAQIAICGPDGQVERVVSMAGAQKEYDLNLALKKSRKLADSDNPDNMLATLPYRIKAAESYRG